jgi:hypothetical protein
MINCTLVACTRPATHTVTHSLRGEMTVCHRHAGIMVAEGVAPAARPPCLEVPHE